MALYNKLNIGKMDKFTKLTDDEGLYKKILREGTGNYPNSKNEVTVKFKGALEDERIIEESDNFKFVLSSDEVRKAFNIGIATMKKGELSIFVIRHDYGYGKIEYENIPPFSTLLYCIELIDFS